MKISDDSINQLIKNQFLQNKHHFINLLIDSFLRKGQILEKLKKYDEAIESYYAGQQEVKACYGS